jgi:Sap, sulfolipid-1-addressing protein
VTPRARANGPAFVAGWLLGLAVVGAIVLLLADPAGAQDEGEPATWVGILELALGLLAIKGWMARHNAVILAVLMLVIGAKLLGEGISGLSS